MTKWSQKYKKSIDCNNPKGFSQKAHCAGKKKKMVEGFKEYMNLVADKKCPDGFKFDKKLQVCVPVGHKYVRYPYFGRIGTTSKNADTDNGNGDNGNGNGGNGNGNGGNGSGNGGNGSGGNGSGGNGGGGE